MTETQHGSYEITELIKLIEKSERGGWRMNVAIHRIHSCQAYAAIESSNFESRHFIDDNAEGFYFGPSYTQSIDAAMSLIPAGWSKMDTVVADSGFEMTLEYPEESKLPATMGTAKTLPLVICAIGLKLQKD